MESALTREKQREIWATQRRREDREKTEAETRVMQLQGMLMATRNRKRQGKILPGNSGGSVALPMPRFWTSSPPNCESTSFCYVVPKLVILCYGCPRNLIQCTSFNETLFTRARFDPWAILCPPLV